MINKACRATRLFFLNSGIAVACWAPMVPYAKLQLNLSETELGLMLFLIGIGALVAMPLSGFLVHRYENRRLIPIASPMLAITLPFLAFTPNVFSLCIALFFFGAILGVLNISVNSQAIAVEKLVGRPMMSNFHCLFSFGGLIGAASMTLLLELGLGLLPCTLLLSVFILLVTGTQCKFLIDCHSEDNGSSNSQSRNLRFPPLIVLFLGFLCFISFLAEGAVLDWGAILLRSAHGYEISIAGIGYAFFAVAMAIGRWSGNYLRFYINDATMIRGGAAIAAIGVMIALNVSWGHLELLGFFLVGIGAANIVPTLFSSAGKLPGISSSLALTTMTTLGYIGLLFGPASIGFIADKTSLYTALSGVALLLMFVAVWGKSGLEQEEREEVVERA